MNEGNSGTEDASNVVETQPVGKSRPTPAYVWLFLACVVGLFIGVIGGGGAGTRNIPSDRVSSYTPDKTSVAKEATKANDPASETRKDEAVEEGPAWSSFLHTGDRAGTAYSPTVKSYFGMSFPYAGTEATISIYCNGDSEYPAPSAKIRFTKEPNIINATPKSGGWSYFSATVEWDGKRERVPFMQEWGGSVIHFRNDQAAIAKLASSNEMFLILRWYGQELAAFKFPLNGSADSIKHISSACA